MAYANMRGNMPRWRKIYAVFWDHHRACFAGKKSRAQRCVICNISFFALDFFPEMTLGDGPKKWHIFLFSAAYFPSYWHMPFEISIIKKPNWHSICTYNFQFQTVTSVMILDFFPKMTRGDGPKNSQIRVKSRALIHLPPESQHERY